MSYHVFFMLSTGLSCSVTVPKGTKDQINSYVMEVEGKLNIKREKYKDNPEHWQHNDFKHLKDKELCIIVERHNNWVRDLFFKFDQWLKQPIQDGEELTPLEASAFWPALNIITLDPERWSADYYRARMETLYEVMRGRPSEGISFDTKPLTSKQAANVILLFSEFLDKDDIRLDVPKGYDELKASYDGGYEWCEICGAVTFDYGQDCRKKKCPIEKEY